MASSRSNRKDTHENLDLSAADDVTLRRRPAARQRPRPDAENFDEEVSTPAQPCWPGAFQQKATVPSRWTSMRPFLAAAFSQCRRRSKKEPRQTSCRGSRIHTSIKRSGQEVAVSANADQPVGRARFVHSRAAEGVGGEAGRTNDKAGSGRRTVELGVQDFHA